MAYKLGGEASAVQNPIVSYVQEPDGEYKAAGGEPVNLFLEWQYLPPDEALRLRGSKSALILREVFVKQAQRLNPGVVDHLMAEELIARMERLPPTREGNKSAWDYIRGVQTVYVAYEGRERDVRLIDTERVANNVFQVTQELLFDNGVKANRIDVAFFINGIPLLLVENKAAHKPEGIAEALDQVRRYHRESPELLAMMQVYALSHLIRFYYSATWNHSQKLLYNWKDEAAGHNYEGLVKTFFDRRRVVQMLTEFILFSYQDDQLAKIIHRPHQMRAVNKLIERAADNTKKRALYGIRKAVARLSP